MSAQFDAIFARLRGILQKHSGALEVTADEAGHYSLYLPYSPKFKKGFPIAWVKISKSYVSYHFMPVRDPKIREMLSKKLQARMQGKTCFNFKVADESLFLELEKLTADGLAEWKNAGVGC
jgi:hypothetical protein